MSQQAAAQPVNRAEGDVDQLIFRTFFGDAPKGVFVDVGAARPDFISMSDLFRKKGWRVVAIEPNPAFADLHRKLGNELYPYACGPEDKDDVEFSIVNSHGTAYEGGEVSFESFSSFAVKEGYAKLADKPLDIAKIKVKMRRLDSILVEAGVSKVDVLSIDVEGWELEVLKGLDFGRVKPRVLIIENFLRDTGYPTFIEALGYKLWHTSFPNEIYVEPEMVPKRSIWDVLKGSLGFK